MDLDILTKNLFWRDSTFFSSVFFGEIIKIWSDIKKDPFILQTPFICYAKICSLWNPLTWSAPRWSYRWHPQPSWMIRYVDALFHVHLQKKHDDLHIPNIMFHDGDRTIVHSSFAAINMFVHTTRTASRIAHVTTPLTIAHVTMDTTNRRPKKNVSPTIPFQSMHLWWYLSSLPPRLPLNHQQRLLSNRQRMRRWNSATISAQQIHSANCFAFVTVPLTIVSAILDIPNQPTMTFALNMHLPPRSPWNHPRNHL